MRYFTKEMWAGWQEDDQLFDQSHFRRRSNAYWKQFSKLESRLGKSTSRFLRTAMLHDSRLLAMVTRDLKAADRKRVKPYPTSVELLVQPSFRLPHRYQLEYSSVRRICFDFPSERPLFHHDTGGIDDWGYDEITAADRKFLRHEVIFSSGATLLIEFLTLKCRTREIR